MKILWSFLIALTLVPAAAAQRSLSIERFHADIVVSRDASIEVTETLQVRFDGSWNGIFCNIPVRYRTPQGFDWTLRLELLSVTAPGEGELRVEQSRQGHYRQYKIWVPGADDTVKTVVLHYRAHNALRFFESHDELYWNVTGDEWEIPIEQASAEISLPGGAEGVRAIAYNGPYGATSQDAEVVVSGSRVSVALDTRLDFQEGLTAVVGWNKGLVDEPTSTDKALGFVAVNWPLALPLPVFVLMFMLWRRHGRDPEELPVVVQYQAPDGLSPAEAGTLMDNSADMRDIIATVVDLAVKGHIRIEEQEVPKLFGLWSTQEFVFHRQPGSATLKKHEKRVLSGIFDGRGDTVALSELENEFYSSIPGIGGAVLDELVKLGYYRQRPGRVQAAWIAVAMVLALTIFGVGMVAAARWQLSPLPWIFAAVCSGLIVGSFALVMPARTIQGARMREKVLGFEEFMRRVEKEHFTEVELTPDLFERGLPYAIAFGVAKQWSGAFAGLFSEPPRWYVGHNLSHFDAAVFSSRMGELTSRASSTMSSAPRSSGGSGFSGGSSGGGGGGGGGGGF